IMTHQPDLQRRLDRLTGAPAAGGSATAFNFSVPGAGGLPFSLAVNGDRATASTSLAMAKSAFVEERDGTAPFDIWTEIYLSKARIGSQEGNFRMIYVGADYRISDGVLIGGLIGLDDFNDDGLLEAGEAEGDGFLAGPYITARLSKDLFAEARAAWGSSDNVVSPLGTFSDEFETTRAFYSGSLIGQFDIGDATRIRPELTVRYIREKQAAYIDSLDITIPEQVVDQGEISFRPRVSHSVAVGSNWTLRPFGEVEGILTFGEASSVAFLNPVAAGPILDLGTLRARVEGGVDLFSAGGVRGSISVFHDGIGSDNFVNTGLHVGLSFGF
ncbi:MAG: autotransporter outer membrane beta-barrel domain-containing protein, partial [Pseudomonadota bacterium]